MRRVLRAGLLTALILLLFVIGGAALVQSRLDQDAIRIRIERQVLAQTGRRLTLGSAHLQLLPVPTLVARDVTLANLPGAAEPAMLPGAAEPAMLTVKELSGHLALWPLLHHVARLDGITLSRPVLLLQRDRDGEANWRLHPAPRPAGAAGGAEAAGAHWQTRIGSLRVLDGSVSWQDRQRGWTGSVTLDRFDASGLVGDSPTFDVAGRHGGAGFTVRASTGGLSRLSDASPTGAWPVHLVARSARNGREDASLSVDGTIADPLHARGYALDIDARAERPEGLDALFPHAAIPALGPISVVTRLVDTAPAGATAAMPSLDRLAARASRVDLGALAHRAWALGLVLDAVSIDATGPAMPLSLSVTGRWQGRPVSVHGSAGTLALWRSRLAGDVTAPVLLALTDGDARASLDGTVGASTADPLPPSTAGPSLHALLAAGPQLDALSVTGTVHLGPGRRLALSGLVLDSRQIGLSGSASLSAGAVPGLTASLVASHLDLDALRVGWVDPRSEPVARMDSPPSGPPSSPRPAGRPADGTAIPFQLLRRADLDVSLRAASVILDRQPYRDLTARLLVRDGALALSPFSVAGPSGPIAATVHADDADHRIDATILPSMVEAGALAGWIGRPIPLDGVVELVGDLHGRGVDAAALLGGLSGRAGASMVGGSIANESLTRVLGRGGAVARQGRTGFRCLALPARLADGVATLDPIVLQTGRLDVQGRGTVRIADGALDLHLLPHLAIGGTGASLPVRVGGSLDAPVAALDPASPGGRFSLTIGGGGPSPDLCGPALIAGRFGAPGPQAPAAVADRPRKLPKPIDILRGLGLFH